MELFGRRFTNSQKTLNIFTFGAKYLRKDWIIMDI